MEESMTRAANALRSRETASPFIRRAGPFASFLLCGLATLGSCSRSDGESKVPAYRGAILITIDTARADHYSAYGYAKPTSPRLDALAARGALFERAVVPIPRTTQSLASLMTGLAPAAHGVRTLYESLDARFETLAESLAEAGYKTGAVVEIPFFQARAGKLLAFGLDQGFSPRFFTDPSPGEWRAEELTDLALKWLEKNQDERFFLWVHYRDPHAPYWPPEPFKNRFDSNYAEPYDGPLEDYFHYWPVDERFAMVVPPGQTAEDLKLEKEQMKFGKSERLTPRFIERAIALYDGEIAYTDHHIGRLLDGLAPLGLEDQTVTVITADHGESLGEHDFYFDHGEFLYDTCLRVPLVIHAPGYPVARVKDLVGTIDVAPTLLELLAAKPLEDIQGRSLVPYMKNETLPAREYFGETGEPLFPEGNPRFGGDPALARRAVERDPEFRQRAFLTPHRFKLIHDAATGKVQIFQNDSDPGETIDRSGEPELERRSRGARSVLEGLRSFDSGADLGELDEETLRILEQNGYLMALNRALLFGKQPKKKDGATPDHPPREGDN